MTAALSLILAFFAVISFSASAQEIAYAYGDSGGRPLEGGNITQYKGTDMVTSAIASGGSSLRGSGTTVNEIKREIDLKINVGNPFVRDEGRRLILEYPGDGTINQICLIYEHMVGGWSYARDTRGIEEFQYSNQSLEYGKGRFSGQGDCDDFSILLASLIESIGGTSRIVLAYGPNGGHAYTEVYLGKMGGSESDVQRMLAWLMKKYNVPKINTHTDLKTNDVWLNLDWWKEPGGAKHPGGPFFKATSHILIPIRENTSLAPLTPLNDPPVAQFAISPTVPNAGEIASFDASKSRDIGGSIDSYFWDFGDGNKTGKMSEPTANHVYLRGGPYTVILTVEDDEAVTNISTKKIIVNNPPQANFTITPEKPIVGDQIKFDSSKSDDAEDGKNLEYHWELNNNSAIFNVANPPKQGYDEKGTYWINLTVKDKNGAKGYKNKLLKINQPPIPCISFDSINLSLTKMIHFSAAKSEDTDGEIVSYAWDFGDNSTVDYNKTVLHSYHEGGKKTIRLSVKDNDGAVFNISREIFINMPPLASFSIDPQEANKGKAVSFNASSSSDPDGIILEYSWDFGEGKVEPDIYTSEFAVHTYYRPQKYNVTLTVKDDKGATGYFSKMVEVKEINDKPIIISLQPDKTSPQEAGTSIAWAAEAMDSNNDQIYYRFFLNDNPVTGWEKEKTWFWTTHDSDTGENQVEVQIRDGKHASVNRFDDRMDFRFNITLPNLKPITPANKQPIINGFVKIKQGVYQALPLQASNDNATVVLFGSSRMPLADENSTLEILKIDIGLIGTENATYQLMDAYDNIYKPGRYKILSSGKQLVYFLVPKDHLFKLIVVTPDGGKPIYINWWDTPTASNDRLILRYYGIADSLLNSDEQAVVVQIQVQNNDSENLYISPENFTLFDQWGWLYRPTLGFNPEIVGLENATSDRIFMGFTGLSPVSCPVALAYDYGMTDQIIIEAGQGVGQAILQGSNDNATAVIFGSSRMPVEDENSTLEILKVDVGLVGAENASYELVDQNDLAYYPGLYRPLSSGKQTVYFLAEKDSLFKLINVTPEGSDPIYINWWMTPNASNDRMKIRYYGIVDSSINSDEQMLVLQVNVHNLGNEWINVTPFNFTLFDQWGWPYHPTLGFDPETVAPGSATSDRLLLGFTGLSPVVRPAALAYDYGASDQMVIEFKKDYVPLSDEVVYGVSATPSTTDISSIQEMVAASKARLAGARGDLE